MPHFPLHLSVYSTFFTQLVNTFKTRKHILFAGILLKNIILAPDTPNN